MTRVEAPEELFFWSTQADHPSGAAEEPEATVAGAQPGGLYRQGMGALRE